MAKQTVSIGQNILTKVVGSKLIIEVDLNEKGVTSRSGKSDVISSTRGNAVVPDTNGLVLGLNAFRAK